MNKFIFMNLICQGKIFLAFQKWFFFLLLIKLQSKYISFPVFSSQLNIFEPKPISNNHIFFSRSLILGSFCSTIRYWKLQEKSRNTKFEMRVKRRCWLDNVGSIVDVELTLKTVSKYIFTYQHGDQWLHLFYMHQCIYTNWSYI